MAGVTRNNWTEAELEYLKKHYQSTTKMSEMCKHLNRKPHSLYNAANIRGWKRGRNQYEFYQGDELLATGTLTDIAVTVGIFEEDLPVFGTPSYAKACPDGSGRKLVLIDDKRG